MVTIQTCASLSDAEVICSCLRGSGVQAFLPDEFAAQTVWSNALGGVRVQVMEEDEARARDILREAAPDPGSPAQE
jgi:hypothetical protein